MGVSNLIAVIGGLSGAAKAHLAAAKNSCQNSSPHASFSPPSRSGNKEEKHALSSKGIAGDDAKHAGEVRLYEEANQCRKGTVEDNATEHRDALAKTDAGTNQGNKDSLNEEVAKSHENDQNEEEDEDDDDEEEDEEEKVVETQVNSGEQKLND